MTTYQIRSYDPDIADFTVEAPHVTAAAAMAVVTMYGSPRIGPVRVEPAVFHVVRQDGEPAGPGHFMATVKGSGSSYGRQFFVSEVSERTNVPPYTVRVTHRETGVTDSATFTTLTLAKLLCGAAERIGLQVELEDQSHNVIWATYVENDPGAYPGACANLADVQ
jgi:hypothetical protein